MATISEEYNSEEGKQKLLNERGSIRGLQNIQLLQFGARVIPIKGCDLIISSTMVLPCRLSLYIPKEGIIEVNVEDQWIYKIIDVPTIISHLDTDPNPHYSTFQELAQGNTHIRIDKIIPSYRKENRLSKNNYNTRTSRTYW